MLCVARIDFLECRTGSVLRGAPGYEPGTMLAAQLGGAQSSSKGGLGSSGGLLANARQEASASTAGGLSSSAGTSSEAGRSASPTPVKGKQPDAKQLVAFKKAFDEFDADGGGTITVEELGKAMAALGHIPSKDELKDMMHEVDADGSGTIEFKEFCSLMMNFGGGSGDTTSAIDAFTAAGKAYQWRKHQIVTEQLDRWWEAMENYLRETGQLDLGLDWHSYLSVFRKVYRAMVDDYDEQEAIESVRADWLVDSKGAERLPASNVRDAVFELADAWCAFLSRVIAVFRAGTLNGGSRCPALRHDSASL